MLCFYPSSNSQAVNVPKLRFPGFSDEWQTSSIGNFGSFYKGASLSKADISESGKPFILYGELYTTYDEVASEIKRKTEATVGDEYYSQTGDVIIPTSGETPEDIATATCVMKPGVILAGDLCIMRTDRIDGRFLSYTINHKAKFDIARIAQGKSIVHIRPEEVERVKVRYPSKPEQEKILCFIELLSQKIDKQKSLIEHLKLYKRGVLQRLFNADITEHSENNIGSLFKVTRGYVLPVSELREQPDREYCYPVYSSQTKNEGLMGFYNQYLYEDAITWTTDGANAGFVRFRKGKFYCTNVCGVLLSDEGFANEYIAEKLNSVTKRHVSYVGNPKLMNNVMAEIIIDYPSVELQKKYSSLVSQIDKKIQYETSVVEALTKTKAALLQQMFI